MSVQRRRYDPDFKRNAVQLTDDPSRSVKDVADNLGITKDLLYKWRREFRAKDELAFSGNGLEALTEQETKIRDQQKKLKDPEMEPDILKKAVAIFSRALK
jgi:transposase-like protein